MCNKVITHAFVKVEKTRQKKLDQDLFNQDAHYLEIFILCHTSNQLI